MRLNVRWSGGRLPSISPRVQVALMSFSLLAMVLAGYAGRRW